MDEDWRSTREGSEEDEWRRIGGRLKAWRRFGIGLGKDWMRSARGLEEDWRKVGRALEDWRRSGVGPEEDWSRIGGRLVDFGIRLEEDC